MRARPTATSAAATVMMKNTMTCPFRFSLNLEKATSREEINEYLRQMAMHSDLQKQIDFVNSQEVVSTDFVGSRHAGVVDAEATIANDNRVVLYVWYDNEFGYSCQVVRVMEDMAGVNPPAFPQ